SDASPVDGQLDPVANRVVFGLAGTPDIAGFQVVVLQQYFAVFVDHAYRAIFGQDEGLVVGAVFLGFTGHQANVLHRAHGGRIEGVVVFTEVDDFLIDRRIAAVRNNGLGVFQFAV